MATTKSKPTTAKNVNDIPVENTKHRIDDESVVHFLSSS